MPSAEEKHLIKRVIGVGGDTITCTAGEPVKVNGTPLNMTARSRWSGPRWNRALRRTGSRPICALWSGREWRSNE
ncbi:S26 family signal peptidase [Streptomyces klenkii]|uniref:S26 family signal peptidase n=1 Tax=Streptomyces klenkii TaxID=1420899 RepID=UPI0036F18374